MGSSIINDEDLVAAGVKYPDFTIDGNVVNLGNKTYTFDNNGSVSSIEPNKGSRSNAEDLSFPSVSDIVDAIKKAVLVPLESLLEGMVDGVKKFLKDVSAAVISKFNIIIGTIQDWKNMVQDTYDKIVNYLKSMYDKAKAGIITAYEFVVRGIKYVFDTLKVFAKDTAHYVIEKVQQGIAMTKDFANKTIKYFHYMLYGVIIIAIIALVVACVFRFAPVDLRIKYVQ